MIPSQTQWDSSVNKSSQQVTGQQQVQVSTKSKGRPVNVQSLDQQQESRGRLGKVNDTGRGPRKGWGQARSEGGWSGDRTTYVEEVWVGGKSLSRQTSGVVVVKVVHRSGQK